MRRYLHDFGLKENAHVLDPFCGTGTTVVEAQLLGFQAFGVEANPMAHFASMVKTDWTVSPEALSEWAGEIAEQANSSFARARKRRTFSQDEAALLLSNSIDRIPLHKCLILRDLVWHEDDYQLRNAGLLALAKTTVQTASNLHFGPEVGVRGRKHNAPVFEAWLSNVKRMSGDLASAAVRTRKGSIFKTDARAITSVISPNSIDAVFTSPPYPNEKDYTRTTRLESVMLGYLRDKNDLRKLKQSLIRSNTRNVYKVDDDDRWVEHNTRIQEIADAIERRRIQLGKTSGFEKLYARVTKLYFGGMARHLSSLKGLLRPGAMLGYVVGDQASYLQVHIATGELLAEIAIEQGYEHVRTDLFRTRIATATKRQMREEIVVLRWRG